jgi:hypothetical protein
MSSPPHFHPPRTRRQFISHSPIPLHTHSIKGGAGEHAFTPQFLSVIPINDIVSFKFYPSNHAVARADYGSAYMQYEMTGRDKLGFWSGEQVVKMVGEVRLTTHLPLT